CDWQNIFAQELTMNSKNTFACTLLVLSFFLSGCEVEDSVLQQPGIIGTLVLGGIVVLVVCVFIVLRLNQLLTVLYARKVQKDREMLKEEILNLEGSDVEELL